MDNGNDVLLLNDTLLLRLMNCYACLLSTGTIDSQAYRTDYQHPCIDLTRCHV
jgi:hypothetical protein